MFERILVPLDGSSLSHQALPYAKRVARSCGSELLLMHVTPQPASLVMTPEDVAAEMGERVQTSAVPFQPGPADRMFIPDAPPRVDARVIHAVERAAAEVDVLQQQLKQEGFSVRSVVRGGSPAEALLDEARLQDAKLIVMSTHGRGGLGRFLLGSVADKVMRHAEMPVMLVRAREVHESAPEFKRILVPLDGSHTAAAVLPAVRELARTSVAEIVLLRVVLGESQPGVAPLGVPPPVPVPELQPEAVASEKPAHASERAATEYIDEVGKSTGLWGVPVRTLVQVGDPASVILDTAHDLYADLIAMSTHGLGGLRRFFLGSVAERVVRHAEAPVLLFRSPET